MPVSGDLVERIRADVAGQLGALLPRDGSGGGQRVISMDEQRELGRRLISERLERHARQCLAKGVAPLAPDDEVAIAREVDAALFGLGGFQRYLDDPEVENINANGCDCVTVRRVGGHWERVGPVAASDEELIELVRTAARQHGLSERRFDYSSWRVSVRLPDGSRLHAVMGVTPRPAVSIRRHRLRTTTLEDHVGLGTFDDRMCALLRSLVLARKNVVICGAPDCGKTTLLLAMLSTIPVHERIVTIEDSLELDVNRDGRHFDVVALEAREPNVEGAGEVTMVDLVRSALRMQPQRIIVGEVRGGEVVEMLMAMGTGCRGSLCTLHADSSLGAFSTMASYAIKAPERLSLAEINLLIANAVDFIVHLRITPDGRRVLSSVREVHGLGEGGMVASNEVFAAASDGRLLPADPIRHETMEELVAAGLEPAVLDGPQLQLLGRLR
jgi:pilus assembly protein CpaF